jgi:hypothetical protein
VTMLRTCMIAVLLVVAPAAVLAQPGPATLITPAADVVGTTVAFTWQSVATATWYQFWLGKADTSLVMEQWVTAENVGCAGGGICTLNLTPPIGPGAFIWHIRTWSGAGYGPWSGAHMFTVKEPTQTWSAILPPSRRFTLVLNNAAVLDQETGLVWQRTVPTIEIPYFTALLYCGASQTGGRFGWRLPTFAELRSLQDPATQTSPVLPAGHPFVLSGSQYFWSSFRVNGNHALIRFSDGNSVVILDSPDTNHRVWCVRGGGASATQ